jgi:1-acyl-sn-glycerol-3-phosphate acyltransferase
VNREPRTANRPPLRRPTLAWLLCAIIVRVIARLRVRDAGRLPDGPAVYACNHLSWIDPLAIIVALGPRRPVVFLAAREHIERRRLLDWVVARLGLVIKIDRKAMGQRDTLRAAERALASGACLALFPEGRINVTAAPLLPLEPGAAAIARRAGVPLVPLAVAGSRELHFRRTIVLACGGPVAPGRTHREDAAATRQLHDTLLALLPPSPRLGRWRGGSWLGRLT